MSKFALFVRLKAKPGQEATVADFLAGAPPSRAPNIEQIELLATKLPG